jgi:hypothetical protein
MRLRQTWPRMRRHARLLLLGALLLGLLAACAPASPPEPSVNAPEPVARPAASPVPVTLEQPTALAAREVAVTILHTNDVRGEIDPCG